MKLVIRIAEQNGQVRAWCPALPGCQVVAATQAEARRRIEQEIHSYLSSFNVALPKSLSQRCHVMATAT